MLRDRGQELHVDFKMLFCTPSPNYCVYANCQLSSALPDLNEIGVSQPELIPARHFQSSSYKFHALWSHFESKDAASPIRILDFQRSQTRFHQSQKGQGELISWGGNLRAAGMLHSAPGTLTLLSWLGVKQSKQLVALSLKMFNSTESPWESTPNPAPRDWPFPYPNPRRTQTPLLSPTPHSNLRQLLLLAQQLQFSAPEEYRAMLTYWTPIYWDWNMYICLLCLLVSGFCLQGSLSPGATEIQWALAELHRAAGQVLIAPISWWHSPQIKWLWHRDPASVFMLPKPKRTPASEQLASVSSLRNIDCQWEGKRETGTSNSFL